jgi:hypothetical protein
MSASSERRQRIRHWYAVYKRTRCCARCGENNPDVLHFHHADPATHIPPKRLSDLATKGARRRVTIA